MLVPVRQKFSAVTDELLELLKKFSPAELNIAPIRDKWTAGQIGDHLFKSYAVVRTLKGGLTISERPPDQKVEEIRNLFLDFSIEMDSPEAILPSEEFLHKEALIEGLRERIEQLRQIVNKEDLTFICTDFAIPEYGHFTRLEWIYFTIFHTQRHNHQVKNLLQIFSAPAH